ncbi:cache domain-containing protein [Thalassotalea euphylliae]|uniref:cache domain-containing protein n=1 Tax=Thalassotalea euphylliae TaxID=1655234 RepID=UPI001C6E84BB|nr:cache domain-containing protein [Thalassotalea euphylliae]
MNLTIKTKLILLASIALFLIGGISIVETVVTKNIVLTAESENVGNSVKKTLQESLQAQIDTVTLSTELFYQQAQQDQIKKELAEELTVIFQTMSSIYQNTSSKSAAKAHIYSFLNHYTWGNNRYVFSYDKDSLNYVTHTLKPALIGTSAKDSQDKNGVYYARNIVNVALESDIGFTKYAFVNPTTNQVEDKLTAAMLFAPLNIVIATGEYISSLQAEKQANALAMITHAKYGKNGYFWVQDSHGVILAHPKASIVGKVIGNTEKIAKRVSTQNDAFIDTTFNNPATDKVESKINYARNVFPDWGWTIVTGAYESDIIEAQEQLTYATQ